MGMQGYKLLAHESSALFTLTKHHVNHWITFDQEYYFETFELRYQTFGVAYVVFILDDTVELILFKFKHRILFQKLLVRRWFWFIKFAYV